MAGVTDRAFRRVCAECGAECVTTEMISAKGVCYGDRKTNQLASLERDIRPAGIQIFGSDPDFLARAAYRRMEYGP
ncbi:MAG: tRNA-dihydrouridine synthase, partial [Clostridia bacterium]|nr:tRNA-dihydrouridine synthase [Clostridia bacterium]